MTYNKLPIVAMNVLTRKILISVVLLAFLIGILNIFQAQIKNSFYSLSYPVEKTFWKAADSASVFFASILNAGNLAKENEVLKTENQKLLAEIISLQAHERKNQALTEILALNQQKDFNIVQADVVGLESSQDIILIDEGLDSKILENMPVINQQKALFGKIYRVYKNFSEVMLISNKNFVLDVKIKQDDATKPAILGIVKGRGGLDVYLDLVPLESAIKEGDILLTSALDGVFPKDLLVGKITRKNKNDQKPFQQAEVEPFFNIKNTENLFVITNYNRK